MNGLYLNLGCLVNVVNENPSKQAVSGCEQNLDGVCGRRHCGAIGISVLWKLEFVGLLLYLGLILASGTAIPCPQTFPSFSIGLLIKQPIESFSIYPKLMSLFFTQ